MEALIAKYSTSFPHHSPKMKSSSSSNQVVILTGSTGALGSYIITRLLQDPNITTVYALNRSSSLSTLLERQKAAFLDRGLPLDLLLSPSLRLVDGADTSAAGLGLPISLYEEIQSSVITIIHKAWRLDFNLSLAQFEPQIAGVKNLIDLALSSPLEEPATFVFTSSVGAVSNWKGNSKVPQIHLEDLSSAVYLSGF